MSDLRDPTNRPLDEMDALRRMLKHERLERLAELEAAIKPWKAIIDRMRDEATRWQGKYAIVKAENNALRRMMYRQNRSEKRRDDRY